MFRAISTLLCIFALLGATPLCKPIRQHDAPACPLLHSAAQKGIDDAFDYLGSCGLICVRTPLVKILSADSARVDSLFPDSQHCIEGYANWRFIVFIAEYYEPHALANDSTWLYALAGHEATHYIVNNTMQISDSLNEFMANYVERLLTGRKKTIQEDSMFQETIKKRGMK